MPGQKCKNNEIGDSMDMVLIMIVVNDGCFLIVRLMCAKIMPRNETTKYSDKEKLNIFFLPIYITNIYPVTFEMRL